MAETTQARIEAHPWYSDPGNRKLILQNLPEPYRWFRKNSIFVSSLGPSRDTQFIYPSDWHNIVEYLLSPRQTIYLLALLHQLSSGFGLGDLHDTLPRWRATVHSMLRNMRSSGHALLRTVLDPDDDGHLPRVRAERWSQRIRSQKAYLAGVQEGRNSYWYPAMVDGEPVAATPRWTNPLDNALAVVTAAAENRTRIYDRDPAKYPIKRLHFNAWPVTQPGAEQPSPYRASVDKHERLLLLPLEVPAALHAELDKAIGAAGWDVAQTAVIPIPVESGELSVARYRLARLAALEQGLPDPIADVRTRYRDFELLRTRTADATVPKPIDPMKKYAVPETFEDDPEETPAPEPEWTPPPLPGEAHLSVGG